MIYSLIRMGLFIALLFTLALISPDASAQVPNVTGLSATGNGSAITVTVEMRIDGDLPELWTGWVVQRSTTGDCNAPTVLLGSAQPFPTGEQDYVLTDTEVDTGTTYRYALYAVDGEGNLLNISGALNIPGFLNIEYASPGGAGAFSEGSLVSDGNGGVQVDLCPDLCWPGFWVPFYSPPELVELADTGATVRLYGTLGMDFEGPYVISITGWDVLPGCGSVATDAATWDGLKAMYR